MYDMYNIMCITYMICTRRVMICVIRITISSKRKHECMSIFAYILYIYVIIVYSVY